MWTARALCMHVRVLKVQDCICTHPFFSSTAAVDYSAVPRLSKHSTLPAVLVTNRRKCVEFIQVRGQRD